ncbi:MAG: heavy metal translocating P-type ATPase [Gammaproteobacteria bacterium]|nr:MAG: heavy metal translocating P-type ATPase [Gammaproteobacteria bacterium]
MIHKTDNCFHCGLPVTPQNIITIKIQSNMENFCCIGCSGVCEVIYNNGLQGFYDRVQSNNPLSPPPPNTNNNNNIFDLPEVLDEYITIDNDDFHKIKLLVEGIHCAACVWLIEKALNDIDGVKKIAVNLSSKSLMLKWNPSVIKLSHISQILQSIGYKTHIYDNSDANYQMEQSNRKKLYRIIFAGFAMMNLLWISISLYSGADEGEYRNWFHILGFLLATPTLFYSGFDFLKGAFLSIKIKHLNMDVPVSIGAVATWSYSTYITFFNPTIGDVYFDTVVNFIFVILIGRYLESSARARAIFSTQRLVNLQPTNATLINNNIEKITQVRLLKIGECVIVRPGEKIPIDGIIKSGLSDINEASITGESIPVIKKNGDFVYAGTINTNGVLIVEIKQILQHSTLGKIIELVERLQESKPPIQNITDKIVPWFVFITLSLSVITFFIWVGVDFEKALLSSVSVLIITCPCAFGLATPMAVAVASGISAKFGILIKDSTSFETLSSIKHFVFDKTGTLTTGKLTIKNLFLAQDITENYFYKIAYSLEKNSKHPVAQAVINKATELNIDNHYTLDNFKSYPGLGVAAIMDNNTKIFMGKYDFLKNNKINISKKCNNFIKQKTIKNSTNVFLGVDNLCIGIITLTDSIVHNASDVLKKLSQHNIELNLLTGDKKEVAMNLRQQLAVNIKIYADLLPEDKKNKIKELQKNNNNKIAMVGDGINDAPALMQADVGIGMGNSDDIALQSSDIILLQNKLEHIHLLISLSKQTIKTIKQNIGLSVLYNIIMVPLAMASFVTPLVAAIAMPISSLLVILNAGLINFKIKKGSWM